MKPSDAQRLKQRFQTPCFECEERYLGCHGKCEKYQAFTKERNNNKKARDETFASQMFYGDEKDIRNFKKGWWERRIALSQKNEEENVKLVHQGHQILSRISLGGIEELQRIEIAGRTCYKSEDKISPDGESAKRFVKMIIDNGHEAMLEHSSLSVRFICSRGVSHEIVRHRLFSFAQESTRYCNYSKGKFGGECTFIVPPDQDWSVNTDEYEDITIIKGSPDYLKWYWYESMDEAEDNYMFLLNGGWSPQEARDVLPNALKTEIVVTGNYREWRHFFKLRCDKAAHPHIRLLAQETLEDLRYRIPVVFDDL